VSIKIAPSFLAADFSNLERDIRAVEEAGVEYIHLDVMDGHFVPNISFGAIVVEAIRKHTDLFLDVHLMITDPGAYIQPFADSGADLFNFHQEVEGDLRELIGKVRDAGMMTGLTMKPATPAESLFPYLDDLDLALVMSVEPGFGGQSFMPDMLPKATELEAEILRIGASTEIEIDGGIGPQNAADAVRAGVRVLVAGSSTFKGDDVAVNVKAIREAGLSGLS
jgi:ribulose-phosphate 3-epimerase